MISIKNISKTFGHITALSEVNLEIPARQIFGFIGPDGAGKTTLFRLITTLLTPGSGTIKVKGFDTVKEYREIRKFTGYMPGRFSLYMDLTVEENLKFYATIFGTSLDQNYHLIKSVYSHIEPFRKRLAGRLSGGMKQKLALSCALIHNPGILVLDEPTTGVDAVSRKEFWELLHELKQQGMTIIVSTPYMDEAGKCDIIALMHKGRLLEVNNPQIITGNFKEYLFAVSGENQFRLIESLRKYRPEASAYLFGQSIHLSFETKPDINDLNLFLSKSGHHNVQIESIRPSVEDCFIASMKSTGNNQKNQNEQPREDNRS